MVPEIFQIQLEGAVVEQVDDTPHLVQPSRLAVGREPHDLVLVAVMREAEKLRHRLVENAERMREIHPAVYVHVTAPANAPGGAGEIPKAIDRYRDGFFEWRYQERGTEMSKVML